jgi:hypothetical protein
LKAEFPRFFSDLSESQGRGPPGQFSRGPAEAEQACYAGRSGDRVRTRTTNPLARIRPNKRSSDPLALKSDPNPSSYPLSRSFETAFIPFPISSKSSRDKVQFKLGKG